MDKQEIYDKVCAHMAQQKRRAQFTRDNGNTDCAYRLPDGRKCAIGALIPDELYVPEMDSPKDNKPTAIRPICERYPRVEELLGKQNIPLCSELQEAHDCSNTPLKLRERLMYVADRYSITPGAEQAITQWS